jgi:Pyruvate/2-oxoacid:ferredoxin oxidoreductase gamma subunit
MLGAVSQLSGVVDADALADALRRRLPARIIELNLKALQLGRDYAARLGAPDASGARGAPGAADPDGSRPTP